MRQSLALLAILLTSLNALAQSTLFVYQGFLNDGGRPANGIYDLTFALCTSSNQSDGVILGTCTSLKTKVSSGLFTANLDFGDVFDGSDRWLEIGARTNGTPSFTFLTPRQSITPTPYALFARSTTSLVGALSAANLAPLTSLLASSSNGLYTSLNPALSTTLAGPTNSGIISSNEYATLNSFPDAFSVVSPLPPVVLNTWYFANGVTGGDVNMTNTMQAYATNGVLAMARKYNTSFYYVVDDFWMNPTNVPNGIFVPDSRYFPRGMKIVADQAHALGMKFGLYPQSNGYGMYCTNLYGNATNMMAWGVDYIKFELGFPGGPVQDAYMVNTLLHPFWTNGHPVFVESGCNRWSPAYTGIVQSPRCLVQGDAWNYTNLMAIVDYTRTFSTFTIGPGRGFFPSIDYVSVALNADEEREHWTAEAMIPASWGFSFGTNDLVYRIQNLTNEDVFSINQDPLVSPGFLVSSNAYVNICERRCVSNTFAISVENRNPFATNYTLWFTNLANVPSVNLIRDCWAHTNCVARNSFTIAVNAHSAALLHFTPIEDALTNIIAVNWPNSVVANATVNGVQTLTYMPLDSDASNYIARAGIMGNPTEMLVAAEAVCLGKQHGWWTNWDALYLFRGSTSNSTAQNLVGTNYGIVWSASGLTFNWAGVTSDGTNGFGDTSFKPSTASQPHFGLNSGSLFVYNRTPAPTAAGNYKVFMGASSATSSAFYCRADNQCLGFFGVNASSVIDNVAVTVEPDSHDFSGYMLVNRYAANAQTIFHDQYTQNTIDYTLATAVPTRTFYIFGANAGGLNYPCGCNLAAAGFGSGMTAAQWLTFESDMKTLMGILGL